MHFWSMAGIRLFASRLRAMTVFNSTPNNFVGSLFTHCDADRHDTRDTRDTHNVKD